MFSQCGSRRTPQFNSGQTASSLALGSDLPSCMGVIYGNSGERPRLKMLSFSTLSAVTSSLSLSLSLSPRISSRDCGRRYCPCGTYRLLDAHPFSRGPCGNRLPKSGCPWVPRPRAAAAAVFRPASWRGCASDINRVDCSGRVGEIKRKDGDAIARRLARNRKKRTKYQRRLRKFIELLYYCNRQIRKSIF